MKYNLKKVRLLHCTSETDTILITILQLKNILVKNEQTKVSCGGTL